MCHCAVALFFVPPKPSKEQFWQRKKSLEKTETPKIEKTETIKEISREESINSTERIIFENNNIVGSISLPMVVQIDDFRI